MDEISENTIRTASFKENLDNKTIGVKRWYGCLTGQKAVVLAENGELKGEIVIIKKFIDTDGTFYVADRAGNTAFIKEEYLIPIN